MSAIALPRGGRRPSSQRSRALSPGTFDSLVASVAVAALGSAVNAHVDWPVLRAQVALATAGIASALVLANRWAAAPGSVAHGGMLAALAGVAAACAALL